jgi:regulatory protein
LLQKRLRSRAELAVTLRRRGVPADDAAAVLASLKRVGWIDDRRFAQAWISDRLALRPRGRRRLRAELLARGVSPADADDALAALLPADRERALAAEQARRQFRRQHGLPPQVARRRLAAWLQRRGFPGEAIAGALRALTANGEEGDPAA